MASKQDLGLSAADVKQAALSNQNVTDRQKQTTSTMVTSGHGSPSFTRTALGTQTPLSSVQDYIRNELKTPDLTTDSKTGTVQTGAKLKTALPPSSDLTTDSKTGTIQTGTKLKTALFPSSDLKCTPPSPVFPKKRNVKVRSALLTTHDVKTASDHPTSIYSASTQDKSTLYANPDIKNISTHTTSGGNINTQVQSCDTSIRPSVRPNPCFNTNIVTEQQRQRFDSGADNAHLQLLLSLQDQINNLIVQQQYATYDHPQGSGNIHDTRGVGHTLNLAQSHPRVRNSPSNNVDPSYDTSTFSQPSHNVLRKEKEPDKFDGKSVDWKDYVIHFEQVAIWNNWSDQEKAQQLAISLRGQAQKLLGDLTPSQLNDYQSLKTTLTERYDPQERGVAYKCEFRARKRNPKESPAEYAFSLRRIACLAFPDIPHEYREVNVLEQYLVGVGNQDLREHIIFKHPKTVDQAIAWTVEYEAVKGSSQSPQKPATSAESGHSNAIKGKQSINANTNKSLESTNSDIQQTLDKLLECMEQLAQTRPKQIRYKKDIECYNCHRKGHIAKDCRQRDIADVQCFKCHNKGHYANNCPSNAPSDQGN